MSVLTHCKKSGKPAQFSIAGSLITINPDKALYVKFVQMRQSVHQCWIIINTSLGQDRYPITEMEMENGIFYLKTIPPPFSKMAGWGKYVVDLEMRQALFPYVF